MHTLRNILLLALSWAAFIAVILYPQLMLLALAIGSVYIWVTSARQEDAV